MLSRLAGGDLLPRHRLLRWRVGVLHGERRRGPAAGGSCGRAHTCRSLWPAPPWALRNPAVTLRSILGTSLPHPPVGLLAPGPPGLAIMAIPLLEGRACGNLMRTTDLCPNWPPIFGGCGGRVEGLAQGNVGRISSRTGPPRGTTPRTWCKISSISLNQALTSA